MIYALDIETRSLTDDPKDTLIPHLSEITIIGLWSPEDKRTFTFLPNLELFLEHNPEVKFIGHNFKFDLKHLAMKGIHIPLDRWAGDTQLMASVLTEKIPPEWLLDYAEKRKEANAKLPRGVSHREGKKHSLKTLAPYFLDVAPFWENPADHASVDYVLQDCKYTYKLWELLADKLKTEGSEKFYLERLLPWTKMLLKSELKGVRLDQDRMKNEQHIHEIALIALANRLDDYWKEAHEAYYKKQRDEIGIRYEIMTNDYIAKHENADPLKIVARYVSLQAKAIAKIDPKINYASSTQMRWLLKDFLGHDIKNFEGKDSSGTLVLNRLRAAGAEDISTFLEYRKINKLLTSFYPTYQKLAVKDALHCQFNPTGTRTGRLSSSNPNLQQVPGSLHSLFIARPGHKLITRDMSAIEPRLAAYYTEDKNLCELIIRGGDFHSRNAIVMFGLDCSEEEVKARYPQERHLAKTCGLALLYGAGPKRIQQTALQQGWKWDKKKCKTLYWKFHSYYKEAFAWKTNFDKWLKDHEGVNYFGRKFKYTDLEEILMKGFNRLIQSTASDLVLNSAWRFTKKTDEKNAFPVLFVHDEIVMEVKERFAAPAVRRLERCMTSYPLSTRHGNIPLEVEGTIGDRWEK